MIIIILIIIIIIIISARDALRGAQGVPRKGAWSSVNVRA